MLFLTLWGKGVGGREGVTLAWSRFFPVFCSPSTGECPALFSLSNSAIICCNCTDLQPATEATTANPFMTSIFAWVVPFKSLSSVTASSYECKNKACVQFGAVKGGLLRSVCQRPINANSAGQAVLAACRAFWKCILACRMIRFSIKLPFWNDKGKLVSVLEELYLRWSKTSFWEQTTRWIGRGTVKEREVAKGEKEGYRCLHICLGLEPVCTNFLLSFWKVGSCSEGISRVLSPCWWELCRMLMPLPFRQG